MPPKFLAIQKNNHYHGSMRTSVALCCSFLFAPLLAHERRRPDTSRLSQTTRAHFLCGSYMNALVVLIATKPRIEQLIQTSLPSIKAQRQQPNLVVIVSDNRSLSKEEQLRINELIFPLPALFLKNDCSPGAAGCWNTGIHALSRRYDDAYVAILDDDDCWKSNHLSVCLSHTHDEPDWVISGIEVRSAERMLATNIPHDLKADDFLISNPGWQGSNTFARLSSLIAVGGFTDGLISSNDRDLAIRALTSDFHHITYTGQATVTWHCQILPDALSAPGSQQKRTGSAQFLILHGHRMSEPVLQEYYRVLESRFGLFRNDIENEIERLGADLGIIQKQSTGQL